MSNLAKRSLSAAILAPFIIFITYKGGLPFFGLVVIAFLIMFYEWLMITRTAKHKIIWAVAGFVYIGFACMVMLFLERARFPFMNLQAIPIYLYLAIMLVWVNDIFSYFAGKAIGGPKLAPKISPNKTWAGAFGGVIACVTVFFIMNLLNNSFSRQVDDRVFIIALSIHIIIPVIAQIGDLLESAVKRKFGVKDSGNIIPGHGGLLDRLDGLLLVMNFIGVVIYVIVIMKMGSLSAMGE